ncbi:TetR/AcrR family transcriptional regulator [Pseudanabaena sp. PCC 6802]|uniref:TetR/AcrR family transcriptional regulator n=1 Tax=Pseudanabaena sp. PCC 6802 TaxID=118173 RepID=UPI00034D22B9|nr:TetR/AcrR family transcriptional regulator [Pseudanabaena sp. PCC 6802]
MPKKPPKAQETKEKILKQSAALFNQFGYAGSSMSDIMRVTGLQKGGIYNHFKSKDELALQAFDYAIARATQRSLIALKGKHHAIERLQALIVEFQNILDDPPIAGGCPILNTAVESDDAYPALRQRVQTAMDNWRSLIGKIVNKGIAKGEICNSVESDVVATVLISTIEGAVMLSKLYGDITHMHRAIAHLNEYISCLGIK